MRVLALVLAVGPARLARPLTGGPGVFRDGLVRDGDSVAVAAASGLVEVEARAAVLGRAAAEAAAQLEADAQAVRVVLEVVSCKKCPCCPARSKEREDRAPLRTDDAAGAQDGLARCAGLATSSPGSLSLARFVQHAFSAVEADDDQAQRERCDQSCASLRPARRSSGIHIGAHGPVCTCGGELNRGEPEELLSLTHEFAPCLGEECAAHVTVRQSFDVQGQHPVLSDACAEYSPQAPSTVASLEGLHGATLQFTPREGRRTEVRWSLIDAEGKADMMHSLLFQVRKLQDEVQRQWMLTRAVRVKAELQVAAELPWRLGLDLNAKLALKATMQNAARFFTDLVSYGEAVYSREFLARDVCALEWLQGDRAKRELAEADEGCQQISEAKSGETPADNCERRGLGKCVWVENKCQRACCGSAHHAVALASLCSFVGTGPAGFTKYSAKAREDAAFLLKQGHGEDDGLCPRLFRLAGPPTSRSQEDHFHTLWPLCQALAAVAPQLEVPFEGAQLDDTEVDSLKGTKADAAPLKVLIVGAGPVGLTQALEFASRGADVTVVEKRADFSRAQAIAQLQVLVQLVRKFGLAKLPEARQYLLEPPTTQDAAGAARHCHLREGAPSSCLASLANIQRLLARAAALPAQKDRVRILMGLEFLAYCAPADETSRWRGALAKATPADFDSLEQSSWSSFEPRAAAPGEYDRWLTQTCDRWAAAPPCVDSSQDCHAEFDVIVDAAGAGGAARDLAAQVEDPTKVFGPGTELEPIERVVKGSCGQGLTASLGRGFAVKQKYLQKRQTDGDQYDLEFKSDVDTKRFKELMRMPCGVRGEGCSEHMGKDFLFLYKSEQRISGPASPFDRRMPEGYTEDYTQISGYLAPSSAYAQFRDEPELLAAYLAEDLETEVLYSATASPLAALFGCDFVHASQAAATQTKGARRMLLLVAGDALLNPYVPSGGLENHLRFLDRAWVSWGNECKDRDSSTKADFLNFGAMWSKRVMGRHLEPQQLHAKETLTRGLEDAGAVLPHLAYSVKDYQLRLQAAVKTEESRRKDRGVILKPVAGPDGQVEWRVRARRRKEDPSDVFVLELHSLQLKDRPIIKGVEQSCAGDECTYAFAFAPPSRDAPLRGVAVLYLAKASAQGQLCEPLEAQKGPRFTHKCGLRSLLDDSSAGAKGLQRAARRFHLDLRTPVQAGLQIPEVDASGVYRVSVDLVTTVLWTDPALDQAIQLGALLVAVRGRQGEAQGPDPAVGVQVRVEGSLAFQTTRLGQNRFLVLADVKPIRAEADQRLPLEGTIDISALGEGPRSTERFELPAPDLELQTPELAAQARGMHVGCPKTQECYVATDISRWQCAAAAPAGSILATEIHEALGELCATPVEQKSLAAFVALGLLLVA